MPLTLRIHHGDDISLAITMLRFSNDYSNTYLTYNPPADRKKRRRGWKLRKNFKIQYFEPSLEQWREAPWDRLGRSYAT